MLSFVSRSRTVSTRSISEEVETYRTLPHDAPLAVALQAHIKVHIYEEPVNEIDVESIWALNSPDWVDLMLYNIARFDVFNMQPTGGYIEHFIRTEMAQLHDRSTARMEEMWLRNKQIVRGESHAQGFCGFVGRTVGACMEEMKDLYRRKDLLPLLLNI